ncbi:unnamed protein product [Protopolystoma xenopodis]|uniref:Uncharacterized protein n=1 Tax=Protopolystoma xenopodis TaxID=117903 RepID=A0A448WIZ7_9PLAT|nr:unnamed protein product [Protopolystoma xenopodis]
MQIPFIVSLILSNTSKLAPLLGMEAQRLKQSQTGQNTSDIQIIAVDMAEDEQQEVLGLAREAKRRYGNDKKRDVAEVWCRFEVGSVLPRNIGEEKIWQQDLSQWSVWNCKDLVKFIKMELDKKFGRLWEVILVQGQYWSYYSHEPGHNFVFKMGNQIFVIWRVPSV